MAADLSPFPNKFFHWSRSIEVSGWPCGAGCRAPLQHLGSVLNFAVPGQPAQPLGALSPPSATDPVATPAPGCCWGGQEQKEGVVQRGFEPCIRHLPGGAGSQGCLRQRCGGEAAAQLA